jgi:DNA-binding NtrC family response regulator
VMRRFHDAVRDFKRQLIELAIEAHRGNRTRAAAYLGLPRTYLLRLIKQLKPRCLPGQVPGRQRRKR